MNLVQTFPVDTRIKGVVQIYWCEVAFSGLQVQQTAVRVVSEEMKKFLLKNWAKSFNIYFIFRLKIQYLKQQKRGLSEHFITAFYVGILLHYMFFFIFSLLEHILC